MKLESLAEMWESFREKVIPAGSPAVQVAEMRRAFYAGAFALLATVRDIGTDAVTEDHGVAHVEALYREAVKFYDLVRRGMA